MPAGQTQSIGRPIASSNNSSSSLKVFLERLAKIYTKGQSDMQPASMLLDMLKRKQYLALEQRHFW